MFDPNRSHLMFWPERDQAKQLELDILIAGCGTNQAAIIAYTNPSSRIMAIDVSKPSLDHQRMLKVKYGLDNLELRLLPIEEVQSLGRDFDLIISTGVLHHMADPVAGLSALASCLRINGVAAIMLYAHYGRIGVEMLQDVFRDMGLGQDESSVRIVKDFLASLSQDHPVKSYLANNPDLDYDAGIVDTFLHGRDRSYTVDQTIALVESSGLVFNDWFLKSPYYPYTSLWPPSALEAPVAALPVKLQWSVMERVHTKNACHIFTACRKNREPSYRINFQGERFLDYVPSLRYRCSLDGTLISRHDGNTLNVDQRQLSFLHLVDGNRTIREIIAEQTSSEPIAALERYARELFNSLWILDFLMVGLRPSI